MSALPPTDRGGPGCTCHECQGIHCLIPHAGHSHRDHLSSTPILDELTRLGAWPPRTGPHGTPAEPDLYTADVPPHEHVYRAYSPQTRTWICECGASVGEDTLANFRRR